MPILDLAVLLSILLTTAAFARHLRRRGLRGWAWAKVSWVGFYGLVLMTTMTAHSLDVLSRLALGRGYDGAPFSYDFRAYALLLLGVLLVSGGTVLVRTSASSDGVGPDGRRTLARTTAIVLALVVPLIPIQAFFALPLTVLGVVTLLVVARLQPAERAAVAALQRGAHGRLQRRTLHPLG